MHKFTSKSVLAIGVVPRIDEIERDQIREFLDGVHPMSPKRKTYDSGEKKKTVLDQAPIGPNEIAEESDDRTSHSDVGSGYDKGMNPGGRADDETGPGFTPNRDPEQEFSDHDTNSITFRSETDLSSEWSPLNSGSRRRDQNVTQHLRRLHSRP